MAVVADTKAAQDAAAAVRPRLTAAQIDLLYVVAIAGLALFLRVIDLGGFPYGLHGDEASTGLDAGRILDGERLFPYSNSALGQPAGPMYWTAPFVQLLGSTITAVRLPMALLGVATVVLGFLAVRELFGRPAAYIAAALLACSSWLIFYNRTGYTVSAMPFSEMASLYAVALALRKRAWPWFALAGVVVGAGIYGYFSYPLFMLALAIFVWLHAMIERPDPRDDHARNIIIMGLAALVVALPMFPYFDGDGQGYMNDRTVFAVSHGVVYDDASYAGKARLYAENAGDLLGSLAFSPWEDGSDGSGSTTALDPILVALAVTGFVTCAVMAWRRRRAAYLLPLIAVPILLIGPVWSVGGYHRRSLGLLPFVIIAAAVALGWASTASLERGGRWRIGAVAVVVLVGACAAINADRYFRQVRGAGIMEFSYGAELVEAARLIDGQPADTHIYLVSPRWPSTYETLRYLAADRTAAGMLSDRSLEFSAQAREQPDRRYDDLTLPALIILMQEYRDDRSLVASKYPHADEITGPAFDGAPAYIAFAVPAASSQP